jgi:hypothetical protein
MKIHSLWFVAVAACALCGCASEPAIIAYQEPLTSPGGEFSKLPPTVQNSVRAEAGMAEFEDISRGKIGDLTVYEFRFKNQEEFPPLYVASDGSVLTSNLTVAVGASEDTIEASTGSGTSSIKMDDLPLKVVEMIRRSAPTAEVDSISRLTSAGEVSYDVTFKDPVRHPKLLIRDDGRLIR